MVVEGNILCTTIANKGPALQTVHNPNNEELYNFEMVAVLKKDKAPFDFNPYSNLHVNAILKKWGYKSRLGYHPTPEEVTKARQEARIGRLGKKPGSEG